MAQIRRIRSLKGAGVLADRSAKDAEPSIPRYTLIYGFNGSGKSTLSRLFASLQLGSVQSSLPEGCAFEFELSDGTILKSPDHLMGLQERVCVFNTDFIERNLLWASGTANSIFYISEEQAEAAAALKAAEVQLPGLSAVLASAEQSVKDKNHVVATFKRGLAKNIAAKLHLSNRKYEAPQLQNDFESLEYDSSSLLEAKRLEEFEGIANRSTPPPTASQIAVDVGALAKCVDGAKEAGTANVGSAMVADLVDHPEMVPWAKTGHEYHTNHKLDSCLFCGESLTDARKESLAAAFSDSLSRFIAGIATSESQANATMNRLELAVRDSADLKLIPQLEPDLRKSVLKLESSMNDIRACFVEIKRVYGVRKAAPTVSVSETLPGTAVVAEMSKRITEAVAAVNNVVKRHNDAVADFGKHQEEARVSIRRHFLSEAHQEFTDNTKAAAQAQKDRDAAEVEDTKTRDQVKDLRNKVRTHGPAAEVITSLVKAYLGHGELSVVTTQDGYELHRHGKLVRGQPSEGEKTALALCYFLSTLGSDGRKLSDLIVVVDDPISSLDTKAMNYACALIQSRLREASQLIVLTHNHHCMNEYKKYWKSLAYPRDEKVAPTAALLFLDVTIPVDGAARSASLVEMSKLLRAYDSEYHFLCMRMFEFEQAGTDHFERGYLMPHIIRRVLELFLAFKVPGSSPIKEKLEAIAKLHPSLDKTRMVALERLSQVESHSDAMEDFISHSSMTIEEARDANAALLELMEAADEYHTKAIRKQCKVAA